ncbi:MAG: hypothetical protein FWD17_12200, partial [Polyangiaceae bacterium]|nr:hypothetical protein [Polyangiaceae bacterium]
VNGRCTAVQTYSCSYDECFSDDDCGPHTPCGCRSSASSNGSNDCYYGSQCAVDSDCGPGGYCSPSPPPTYCASGYTAPPGFSPSGDPARVAYFCHTPADTCTNDTDCGDAGALATTLSAALCLYDAQAGHWSCQTLDCYLP